MPLAVPPNPLACEYLPEATLPDPPSTAALIPAAVLPAPPIILPAMYISPPMPTPPSTRKAAEAVDVADKVLVTVVIPLICVLANVDCPVTVILLLKLIALLNVPAPPTYMLPLIPTPPNTRNAPVFVDPVALELLMVIILFVIPLMSVTVCRLAVDQTITPPVAVLTAVPVPAVMLVTPY
jgi:hypothetical protein